ncbi:MAG: hypothetical protein UW11_C0019G0013 [Parcubacteria group bacterium GW2011_GWA2_43_9b]|nr:MAG: hypothetical protein UW11_C0019G0013 [Parcubacteria group bacterium GW2011_GWA2_43_9b]
MENNNDFITKEYLDKKLDDKFKEYSQVLVVALDGVLEKRLQKTEERLGAKIGDVKTLIDGYIKAQEGFKQEFVVMKEEIKKIKDILKEKLGVEVSAF